MISLNSSIGLFVPACHALLEDVIVEACEVESGEIHIRHDARAYASTVMILHIGHETARTNTEAQIRMLYRNGCQQ